MGKLEKNYKQKNYKKITNTDNKNKLKFDRRNKKKAFDLKLKERRRAVSKETLDSVIDIIRSTIPEDADTEVPQFDKVWKNKNKNKNYSKKSKKKFQRSELTEQFDPEGKILPPRINIEDLAPDLREEYTLIAKGYAFAEKLEGSDKEKLLSQLKQLKKIVDKEAVKVTKIYESTPVLLSRHSVDFVERKPFVDSQIVGYIHNLEKEHIKSSLNARLLVDLSRADKKINYKDFREKKYKNKSLIRIFAPKFALIRYVRKKGLQKWFRRGSLGGGLWWKRPYGKKLYKLLLRRRLYAEEPLARIFKKKYRMYVDIFKKRESVLANKTFGSARMLSKCRILIKRSLNNVFVHLQNLYDGTVTALNTGGTVGYKGSKKATNITAEKVAAATARECLMRGYKRIDVAVDSPFVDSFIKSAIAGLLFVKEKVEHKKKSGDIYIKKVNLVINNVLLSLSKTHNGVRLPKARRV